MLGDLKIIRTNRTNPAEENGWHVPPGEDGNTTVYTAASRCDKHLQQGDANKEAGATCGYPDWCLFNITADVCEYVFSYLWGACVHTLGCLGVLCVRYLRVRTHDVLFLSFPFLSFPFLSLPPGTTTSRSIVRTTLHGLSNCLQLTKRPRWRRLKEWDANQLR